jgi:hypothetical protein
MPFGSRLRNDRDMGLTAKARKLEIERRFGAGAFSRASKLLAGVNQPTNQILGAIVFLARSLDDLPELVDLANRNPQQLLDAATVKEERG